MCISEGGLTRPFDTIKAFLAESYDQNNWQNVFDAMGSEGNGSDANEAMRRLANLQDDLLRGVVCHGIQCCRMNSNRLFRRRRA